MSPIDDTVNSQARFRDLRLIGGHVEIADLAPDQMHYGEDYLDSSEPWARVLQEADATFTWLAFSFGSVPMSELHVGVVLVDREARVGFHAHVDARPEFLEALDDIGKDLGPASLSEAAGEMQHNEVFDQYGEDDLPRIAQLLSRVYTDVRAQLQTRNLIEK